MKITVITVCLNSAKTIERTIQSVMEQNYPKLEYIIIDGGSTDGTLDILRKYETHIDKWVSEPDKGLYDAMNKGIRMATGDVIAFLNSDDWYEKDVLKLIEGAFDEKKCDCVCCDNYFRRNDGQVVYRDCSNDSIDDLHICMVYQHSAIFCKKIFFDKKENFNLRYKIAADYDWVLRVLEQGATFYYIHKPVFTFSDGGISRLNELDCIREAKEVSLCHLPENNKEEYRKKIGEVYKKALRNIEMRERLNKILNQDRPIILWGAGRNGKKCIRWLRRCERNVVAIADTDHTLWGKYIEEVPICSPKKILKNKVCNLIITPEDYYDDIKETAHVIEPVGINFFQYEKLYMYVMGEDDRK